MIEFLWRFLPDPMRAKLINSWFNGKRRRAFYMKVAELNANGVTPDILFASFVARAKKKNPASPETWLYEQMQSRFNTSGTFTKTIAPYVPDIDLILIAAGEAEGNIAKTLRAAADLNEKGAKMKGLIRKAVSYPVFLFLVLVAAICWFGMSLFPTFADFYEVSLWPPLSRSVYAFSRFVLDYYWLILTIFAAAIVAIAWSFRNLTGSIRIRLDKIPPWSLYRLSQGGAWLLSVTSMVEAGISNAKALETIQENVKGNRWLKERTEAVRINLSQKSRNMGEALSTKFMFPDEELCWDLLDYAKTGNFNEIFERIGKEWVEVGVANVEEQSKKLNNFALALVLVCIGVFAQSVLGLLTFISSNASTSAL